MFYRLSKIVPWCQLPVQASCSLLSCLTRQDSKYWNLLLLLPHLVLRMVEACAIAALRSCVV